MPYTSFEPFHVYEINQKHPAVKVLPYKHFLCLTMPEFTEPQLVFNVVGFPILTFHGRIVDKRLRLPLDSRTVKELLIPGGPTIAIDLLQPLNKQMLHETSIGQLSDLEIIELKRMTLRFLALG